MNQAQVVRFKESRIDTAPSAILSSKVFLVVLLPLFLFVLVLTIATPPLQVPDEMQHFYRAYQIGDPAATSVVLDGVAGADLPSSLSEQTLHFLQTKALHVPRPVFRYVWRDVSAYLDVPLDPTRREFTAFSSQIIYSPAAYLPQAAAIATARSLGFGPLVLLYSARLANAIVALAVVTWAMHLLPGGRMVIVAATLLPMAAYEFASASADGQVIAFAALIAVLAIRGIGRGHWLAWEIALGLIAGLIVTTAKFPYLPLLLIALPTLLMHRKTASTVAFALVTPGVCAGASLLWLGHVAPLVVISNPDLTPTNATDQLDVLRQHPTTGVTIAFHALTDVARLVGSMVGQLGWLTVPLPKITILLALISFACAILLTPKSKTAPKPLVGMWIIGLGVASYALICIALYLTWTQVGSPRVQGLQGRYLLPILPFVLLGLPLAFRWRPGPALAQRFEWLGLTCVFLNAATCLFVSVRAFWYLG